MSAADNEEKAMDIEEQARKEKPYELRSIHHRRTEAILDEVDARIAASRAYVPDEVVGDVRNLELPSCVCENCIAKRKARTAPVVNPQPQACTGCLNFSSIRREHTCAPHDEGLTYPQAPKHSAAVVALIEAVREVDASFESGTSVFAEPEAVGRFYRALNAQREALVLLDGVPHE